MAAATGVRQLLFPLWYVRVRLVARPGRIALAVAGIAAAAALLASVLAGALVAQDRTLAHTLGHLSPAERGLRAAWFGAPRQGVDYSTLDRAVEGAFTDLGAGEPVRAMQYKQTRVDGKLVDLGAVDGLERWVRLRSGRLPHPCRPERCEVVQLGGSGPIPNVSGLRLVRVGRGTLASEVPFGRLAPAGAGGIVETVGARFAVETRAPPFLVAEGVAGLAGAPELASIFRSYAWFAPIEPGAVRPWQVDRYAAAVDRTRSRLKTASFLFDLTAPVEALQAAAASGRASARRVLLLGGEAAALVLAFVVLAAAGLRRALEADLRRMSWYGASGWQLALRSAGEAALLGLSATALGWALGTGVALALAERAGSPGGAVARHSILSGEGLLLASLLGVAAAAALLAALRARPLRVGFLSLSLVDVAALGALAAISVGLVRGETGAAELAEDEGAGAFLALLPALVTFVAAVVIVRAAAPLFRLLERFARRLSPELRFAALSLARSPGRAAVVAAFLAASLALAFFAAAYRATLERGQVDQARFAVPLDFTLREDLGKLVPPLELAPLSRYERLGDGVDAVPVVRLSGSVSRLETSRGVTLLGIPAGEVSRLPGWRRDFAAVPAAELDSRISTLGAVGLRGPRIPARELQLRAKAKGDDVVLVASIAARAGGFLHLELGETRGARSTVLRAALPARARGGRLVALTVGLTDLSRETGEPLEGTLSLGPLTAKGSSGRTVVTDYHGWVGSNGLERTGGCCATTLRYFITNQVTSRFRPPQLTDGRPIPVIASPPLARAAGPGGVLPVHRVGQQLAVRVVAVARRFPSVEGDFVIAEIGALRTALDADKPGSAPVGEIWLRVPPASATTVANALRKRPFGVLRVESRGALERELRADPLARATLATLAAAALAGLLLALLGLFLAVASDLRDERRELFDLETEGAEPGTLRRHVHLRASLTAAIGLLGGIGLGAALAALTVDLVRLTAAAALPEPPLLLEFDWTLVAAAACGYLAAATVLVAALTWSWFRAGTPARPTPEPA